MRTDQELMRCYIAGGEEEAFRELVQRHIDFVYATALRHVGGDAHHAGDIAQYVFTQLARDAVTLSRHPVLTGWLYLTARNAAANVVRADRRRQTREHNAHAMQELTQEPGPIVDWNTLRPVIDDALCALGARDREAVLLRFFEQRTFADIGASLALTGDAVRLRVERALEKMRGVLARRGIASTAAALATALAHRAEVGAPNGMAAAVATAALTTGAAIKVGLSLGAKLALSALGLGMAAGLGVLVSRSGAPPPAAATSVVSLPAPRKSATAPVAISALRESRMQGGGRETPAAPRGAYPVRSLPWGVSPFPDDGHVPIRKAGEIAFKHTSFTFVRVSFDDADRRGGPIPSFSAKINPQAAIALAGRWTVDYPNADLNFSARFQEITGLKTDPEGKIMALFDAEIRQQPFIYMVEGGRLQLTEREREGLRAYLLGGGFLLMDDFWGEVEWKHLQGEMKKVLPESEPMDLPRTHPIYHSFYQLPDDLQVPSIVQGVRSRFTGETWEREDGKEVHLRGLHDPKGRLVAVFCHNTDLGDGWERIDEDAYYYREFTLKKAYPLGINIVVYALSQ